ncbi:hypothetical protein [Nostoc sp.]|uniref:hypothetical protein n=1 Tax=Nostoc sp. TaxID=1180 RepID=UPI002FF65D7B
MVYLPENSCKNQEVRDIVEQMLSRVLQVISYKAISDNKPLYVYARGLLGGMLDVRSLLSGLIFCNDD